MDTDVQITMLPVSAGDSTLLVASDRGHRYAVLIDAGLGENEVASYLQSIGIFHLDLIILSHPDMDHLGGLLSILKSEVMSVDCIWCFDLAFLRDFVRTGVIPRPRPATHEVVYELMLRSTLDQFSEVLEIARERGTVRVFQVAEGHRLCLGPMLLEVLYPPQVFIDSLRDPRSLKRLLVHRRLPSDWKSPDRDEESRDRRARPINLQRDTERLATIAETREISRGSVLLTGDAETRQDSLDEESEESPALPFQMVGTLYNNMSIVVKVSVLRGIDGATALFPGDLTDWTLLLMRQWSNLGADVFKLPHHGSCRVGYDGRLLDSALRNLYYFDRFCRDYPVYLPDFVWPLSFTIGSQSRPISRIDWRERLEELWDTFHSASPAEAIASIVKPSHVLVFPFPQHKLPDTALGGFPNVLANRANRTAKALIESAKQNPVRPATLRLGIEKHEVAETPPI